MSMSLSLLITVENIKCGGCAHNIKQTLEAMQEIESVVVDVDRGEVLITHQLSEKAVDEIEILRNQIKAKLLAMGYPEVGSVEGLKSAKAKAKSFVSCAIGKMSEPK